MYAWNISTLCKFRPSLSNLQDLVQNKNKKHWACSLLRRPLVQSLVPQKTKQQQKTPLIPFLFRPSNHLLFFSLLSL